MRSVKAFQPAEHVLEVVTPRTNAARLSPAEHLFGAVAMQAGATQSPVAFEIVGDHECRRFLVRTASGAQQQQVAARLGAAYPQAALRPFDAATLPAGDPARLGPDEQAAVTTLRLRLGEHLPLRMLEDRELDATSTSAQADPLLGVLGAMADLPAGWRMLAQLVLLAPAPAGWARPHQRLALERPLEQERARDTGPSLLGPVALLAMLGLYLAGSSALEAWSSGDWIGVVGIAAGLLGLGGAALLVARWLGRRELVDPRLVQAKLARDACQVELRLAVFAPAFVDAATVLERLDRLVAAYRPFSLAAGNSLVPVPVGATDADLRVLAPLNPPCLLNVRELAGLWHLVQADDDVSLLERTTARRRLPLPAAVAAGRDAQGYRIGTSDHQGHSVSVFLPDALLRRHLLAVAKTRRGKSSLLLRLARHLMWSGRAAGTGVPSARSGGRWCSSTRTGTWPPRRSASSRQSGGTTSCTWTSRTGGGRSG